MKLYEAKNIITDVFEYPFDKDKFRYFIRNLLKNLHPAEFRRSGYNIPKAFEDFIASYERLGKYEDEEGNLIDVLIIKLKRDHSIDYARSTQRNFVRWYLNDKGKDAALVAFTTEKSSEWRFSFIKMQYSLEKKKDELTPAKRSSFMVGESGKSHTAQRQLIDLLKNDHAPYLSDIEDAFSIEAVSDEFYEKYKALLFNLVDEIENVVKRDKTVKDEFESKEISILNFSKKLLGQIVFLYFLQKKGWLGLEEKEKYGEGDKNFLRSLFNETKKGENFFNDYLEYLFYDALSKKRVTDYYDRFKTRIPFLNGGLFDPIEFYDWQKTDIVIPNDIFSNRKGDEEGNGILDVFDLYNFTVKEDEPLETEVAIDPEMLGKVFERMLEVTERKSKGAFYTPREIVHYMAQQSLLYFLETELNQTVSYNKLGDTQSDIFGNEVRKGQLGLLTENKACAVPKVDLEKFIHFGEHIIDKDIAMEEGKLKQTANKQTIPESIRQHADAIDQALKNIKICDPAVGSGAFPVGIMNEIVKLRKLLTPFLKKESADERSAYRFKSNAIQNSIYGVDIDAGAVEIAKLRLWLSMVVDEERINNIEPLPNLEYKIVKGNSLINMPVGFLRNGDLEKQIEELTENYKTITDKEIKQKQKEIIDGKIQQLLVSASEFAGYKIDFDFKLFFHEVWNEKNGFDVVIGNPPFVFTRGQQFDENLKNYLHDYLVSKNIIKRKKGLNIQSGKINFFTFFIIKSLDILNANSNLSFIIPNNFLRATNYDIFREYILENYNIKHIVDLGEGIFKNVTASTILFSVSNSKDRIARIYTNVTDLEKYKYEKNYVPQSFFLSNVSSTINIFITPEVVNLIEKIKLNSDKLGVLCKNISPGIDGDKNAYVAKEKTSQLSKPLLFGKDIKRYQIHFKNNYIEYNRKLLNRARDESIFKSKKIILQRISGGSFPLTAAYDEGFYYTFNSVNNIILNENYEGLIKFVLGVLNSALINWYYGVLFSNQSKLTVNISKTYLENLPIKTSNKLIIKSISTLSNILLFLKSQPSDKISFYFEQLIDGMVYELYFEKEIKQAGCDILKYLDDLPEINDEMKDEEKMKIITKVFNKLYDKESPVRKNLFFMDSVEEVAIIKKSLEK
mgnify:CR=1 FL=1